MGSPIVRLSQKQTKKKRVAIYSIKANNDLENNMDELSDKLYCLPYKT